MNVEKELIRKCMKKQRKAQLELYRACYPSLMKICLRYKNNKHDAAAMVNEGMLKILEKLDTYREQVPFEAWVHRVMINTLIDDYRKYRNKKEVLRSVEPNDLQKYEMGYSQNHSALHLDAEGIRKLINLLPGDRKEIFNLFAIDGYSHQEISDMLGVNVNTCRWHVAEARKYLQSRISGTTKQKKVGNESV